MNMEAVVLLRDELKRVTPLLRDTLSGTRAEGTAA
jgi:hypothetical protein